MLCITRKQLGHATTVDQKSRCQVHIGRDITVTVLEIQGDKVRLGIEAPREVNVWRGELTEETKG